MTFFMFFITYHLSYFKCSIQFYTIKYFNLKLNISFLNLFLKIYLYLYFKPILNYFFHISISLYGTKGCIMINQLLLID